MSKYHKKCTEEIPEESRRSQTPAPLPPIEKKPFCDCSNCECTECPDILDMLSITITDTTCVFSPRGNTSTTCDRSFVPQRSSLLDVLNPERACDCDTVARAVRSDLHMNLGLSQHRDTINKSDQGTSTDPDCDKSTQ